jgi:hypothetical protein
MSGRHTSRLFTSNLRPALRLSQLRSHFPRPAVLRTMATTIPKTMKGVLVEKPGGVEVLEYKTDLPVPTPKHGEVLVKNEFTGVNYIDTYVLLPPPSSLLPFPLPLHLCEIPLLIIRHATAISGQASTPPPNLRS